MTKSALIFDMDGVLFLSNATHERAYREVLRAEGIGDFDYQLISGMRTDEALTRLFCLFNLPLDAAETDRLRKAKQASARKLLSEDPPVVEGCAQVLTELARYNRLALATSASRGTVEIFLSASGCRQLFQTIISGEDVSKAKPDPEIYLRAASELQADPSICWVVEDAVNGIVAAKKAGMRVICIGSAAAAPALLAAGAIEVIPELNGLARALQRAA